MTTTTNAISTPILHACQTNTLHAAISTDRNPNKFDMRMNEKMVQYALLFFFDSFRRASIQIS